MFALQARPSALPVAYPASRQSLPPAAEILPSANCIRPHLHAQPSSVPCDSAPAFSPPPALFVRSSAQERKLTPLFSGQGSPLRDHPSQQPQHSQSVTNSFTQDKIITPAFPAASELFVRSFAQERRLTPVLSCACALFRKTTGEGVGVATKRLQPQLQVRPLRRPEVSYSGGFHSELESSPMSPR